MNDLTFKYNQLDSESKKEVLDFVDFLIQKKSKRSPVSTNYSDKILNVSVWNESDINLIIQNQHQFNQWKIQEW